MREGPVFQQPQEVEPFSHEGTVRAELLLFGNPQQRAVLFPSTDEVADPCGRGATPQEYSGETKPSQVVFYGHVTDVQGERPPPSPHSDQSHKLTVFLIKPCCAPPHWSNHRHAPVSL